MLVFFRVVMASRTLCRGFVVYPVIYVMPLSIWVGVQHGEIFASVVLLEKGKNFLFIPAVDTTDLFMACEAKVGCWPLDFWAFRVFAGCAYMKKDTLPRAHLYTTNWPKWYNFLNHSLKGITN